MIRFTYIVIFWLGSVENNGERQWRFEPQDSERRDLTLLGKDDDYNIQRECTDPNSGEKYQIGETWNADNACIQYKCIQFDINRLKKQPGAHINRHGIFAVVKVNRCIKSQDVITRNQDPDYCEMIPEDIELEYPNCCTMFVCIRANQIVVYRTNSTGDKSIVTRAMRKLPGDKPNQTTREETRPWCPRRNFDEPLVY